MMCQSHQTSEGTLLIASMVVVSKIWPHKDLTSHTESCRTNLCNHSVGAGTWVPFEFAPLVSFGAFLLLYGVVSFCGKILRLWSWSKLLSFIPCHDINSRGQPFGVCVIFHPIFLTSFRFKGWLAKKRLMWRNPDFVWLSGKQLQRLFEFFSLYRPVLSLVYYLVCWGRIFKFHSNFQVLPFSLRQLTAWRSSQYLNDAKPWSHVV